MDREGWIKVFTGCGIDPSARAEDLSLEDYAGITNLVFSG